MPTLPSVVRAGGSSVQVSRSRALIVAVALLSIVVLGRDARAQTEKKPFTLEQTQRSREVDLNGRLDRYDWAFDGRHLERRDGRSRAWFAPSEPTTEIPAAEPPPEAPSVRDRFLEAWEKSGREPLGRNARRVRVEEAGARWFAEVPARGGSEHYVARVDGESIEIDRVDLPEEARLVEPSPDGTRLSFVDGYDLAWRDLDSGERVAVTEGGTKEGDRYGCLDWVYQEEIYGRGRWKGYWWSPTGDHVAFLKLDEREVLPFTIVDHLPVRSETEVTAYPKAGDPNPKVGLGVADRAGRVQWVDLSGYPASDEILIVRVGWTPSGDRVVFAVQNRTQTWLDLNVADPATGEVTRWMREESETWVNVHGLPRWLEDGTFLWTSERTGYAHLYHYRSDGTLVTAITAGPVERPREWEVDRILRVDEERGWIWFTGGESGAESHAFRVRFDGSELARLTHGAGTHRITLNEDGSFFLDEYSSASVPPQVRLCSGDGRSVHVLASAEIPDLDTYDYRPTTFVRIPARDGYPLEATVLLPSDYDPTRRYPVWLPTYSGPDAPTVRHSWQTNVFDQFLAQQGLIVFKVNNRSSSGRGQRDTAACYRDLGASELRDLVDALDWLGREYAADLTRVGISGWSYGGFMAAYALTHSDRFALGVAGAGVYDWRNYDTVYTERYMSTPQDNPEGYESSSCVEAAKNLSGHLVLVHGTNDDNVHVQNTLQFAYALQRAGRQFDLMLYPRSRHGLGSGEQRWHFRELTWNAIREHLLAESAAQRPTAAAR